MRNLALSLSLLIGSAALGGCQASLYDRLGGEPGITAVVDDFLPRLLNDPKVDATRGGKYLITDADKANTRKHLIELMCSVTGGPQAYTGRDMRSVHTGMKITEEQFNASAGDLVASLKVFHVGQREIDELIARISPTKGDIVGR